MTQILGLDIWIGCAGMSRLCGATLGPIDFPFQPWEEALLTLTPTNHLRGLEENRPSMYSLGISVHSCPPTRRSLNVPHVGLRGGSTSREHCGIYQVRAGTQRRAARLCCRGNGKGWVRQVSDTSRGTTNN